MFILRHGRFAASGWKYPTDIKLADGTWLLTIPFPQLETQLSVPSAAVPGEPVTDLVTVQYSAVIPHCPLVSQHAFRGQGLRSASCFPRGCETVPLTHGPQTDHSLGTGSGALPGLKHIV